MWRKSRTSGGALTHSSVATEALEYVWIKWFFYRGARAHASVSPLIHRSQLRWFGNPARKVFPCQETQDMLKRLHLLRYCPGGAGGIVWGTRVKPSLPHDPEDKNESSQQSSAAPTCQCHFQGKYYTDLKLSCVAVKGTILLFGKGC